MWGQCINMEAANDTLESRISDAEAALPQLAHQQPPQQQQQQQQQHDEEQHT
jgi:hypothetical protein